MSGRRLLGAALLLTAPWLPGDAAAAPSEDRLLPLEQYTSDKGRSLALAYGRLLRELNTRIYHCLPWLEVQKQSIGFFKPKHLAQDDRYFSLRVYIEQDPSPRFAGLPLEQRAAAMFSRYVGPLLRRMGDSAALVADRLVDGFTLILEWLKQAPAAGARPVHETMAVFVEKPTAAEYLAGRLPVRELAARARVLAWDGERALGQLRLSAWDDDFVATYKVKNYQLEAGVTCP